MRQPACAALLAALLSLSPASSAQTAGDSAHLAATAREHAHDTPAASPAASTAPRQEVVGREVEYGRVNGKSARGFLARPANAPRGQALPGILLVHEWWGLNDNIRSAARRLAGEGYQVLAIDMYGGRVASTPEEARGYVGEIMANSGLGAEHLRAGTDFLAQRQRAPRLAVMGWCFGGGWALQGALLEPERVHAAVMYYGRPVTDPQRLQVLRAPLLGLFGAEDRSIPVEMVRQMETALREQGKDVTVQVYEGAGHAFANPSGENYRAEAAEDAWRRTTAFLARTLRPAM